MQNLRKELIELLTADDRLVADGILMKNKVVELALNLDAGILRPLLAHEGLRHHFFTDIEGTLVFDKVKFQRFVSNKAFLPDSYTAFKNKIGLMIGNDYHSETQEVVLAWPYEDCILEGGQDREDVKRDEVFWNETLATDQIDRLLAPKALTGFKRFSTRGEEPLTQFDKEENLLIRGNNLLAITTLTSLYLGSARLIYIDPPYNTESDGFKYNDSFTHSTWLTFMRNRLNVARQLLKKDGVICINIDDKECYYLKVLCDEIFGRDNFITSIVVKTSDPSGHKTVNPGPYSQSEYVLMYARDKKSYKYDIAYVPSPHDAMYSELVLNVEEPYENWIFGKVEDVVAEKAGYSSPKDAAEELSQAGFFELVSTFCLEHKNRVFQRTAISKDASKEAVATRDKSAENPNIIYKVDRGSKSPIYVNRGRQIYFYSAKVKVIDGVETPAKPLTKIWSDIPYNGISGEGGVKLKNGKKPEKLLRRIIDICTNRDDLVIDFHAGSGTTLAVSHKMGRKYIGVEQLDYQENDSLTRLKNVIGGDRTGVSKLLDWQGGGSFVYCELAKANEVFVERIREAKSNQELCALWQTMQDKAFLSYRVQVSAINSSFSDFEALPLDDQKRFLIEVLDKNMLYVPLSEIDDAAWGLTDADKALNHAIFHVAKV